jgi:hypothetical protein
MSTQERREHRRTRLRLRVSQIKGLPVPDGTSDLWTSNVSPGGMYVRTPFVDAPAVGTSLTFELSIPPGEGYSISAGRIRGSCKVVRVEPCAGPVAGLAVGFTSPLALEF